MSQKVNKSTLIINGEPIMNHFRMNLFCYGFLILLVSPTLWAEDPSPRMDFAFTYDPVNQVSVLFGGFYYDEQESQSHLYNDTWTWNGSAWTEVFSATQPSPRLHQTATYDLVRNQIVLFGGIHIVEEQWTSTNEVWLWNGSSWSPQAGNPALPTVDGELAFDSGRGVTVLYAGNSWGDPVSETWEFDGSTWVKKETATVPPARMDVQLVFDSERNVCVLFGGDTSDDVSNDTWEYNGSNWIKINTVHSPDARMGYAMAYDSNRKKIVLFGGYNNDWENPILFDDTWEYNGSDWIKIETDHAPTGRWVTFMTYDSSRNRCVLFGGENKETGPTLGLGDTWEYNGVDWTNDFSSTQVTATPTQTPEEATATPTTPETTPTPTLTPTRTPEEETPTPTSTPTSIVSTPTPKSADLDGSGEVNEKDLILFMEQWHESDT